MKTLVLLGARRGARDLHHRLLERYVAGPPDGCAAIAVNLVESRGEPSAWDAVVELWCAADRSRESRAIAAVTLDAARCAVYRVTELVEKDTGPPRGWPTPGIKSIVAWTGRSDVVPREQRRHWDEHVPLANRVHVGVSRYVRNWIESPEPGTQAEIPPYRGIAMQHFPSEADQRERLFDSPDSVPLILNDVADFIAEHVVLTATEYYRPAETASAG